MSSAEPLLCVFCRSYLLNAPRQAPCGDRLCETCYTDLIKRKQTSIPCPRPSCQEEITLRKCFRDKAVEMELASIILKCTNPGCTWEGESKCINDHLKKCKLAVVNCPTVGCSESICREAVEGDLSTCPFNPVLCDPSGEKTIEKEEGNADGAKKHSAHYYSHEFNRDMCQSCPNPGNEIENTLTRIEGACSQQLQTLKQEINKIKSELLENLQPMVDTMVKVESTVQQLQEGFGEMALMVQTLQATSYSGTFIWKIPEVRRRRNEAKAGKTISLYSTPFYTSRHGYKLCLRLYMDGDGGGKGTHLSFFLTIMRGEYDALLPWPFRQIITLTLLNQDKQHDIIQSFRPEPTSSSFQRPHNEMNVASGCPKFVFQSVLDSSSFVRNDTLVLLFKVHLSGINSGAGIDPGYLASQSSSASDLEPRASDRGTRKLKKVKCRKRGCKTLSTSPSTTPTSDQPASPVSEAGSISPAMGAHGHDHVPSPFTSVGGGNPSMPIQRVTSSDSEGLEPHDRLTCVGRKVLQLPVKRVYTSSDLKGSEPQNCAIYRLPETESRIYVDVTYIQQELSTVLEELNVDPTTRDQLLKWSQNLHQNSRLRSSSALPTPPLWRRRSIAAPPVTKVRSRPSQLPIEFEHPTP